MKITCTLISCQTYKTITSIEVEASEFGLSKDNPFPVSKIWTGSLFGDSVKLTYIVQEAIGDLGSQEAA